MSTIKFTSLHCVRQQDVTGSDEAHIFLDGVDSWNGALKKGDSEPVNLARPFDGSMQVVVKEKNPSSWKTLGTVTIDSGDVSPAVFKTSGAHYELWFAIN